MSLAALTKSAPRYVVAVASWAQARRSPETDDSEEAEGRECDPGYTALELRNKHHDISSWPLNVSAQSPGTFWRNWSFCAEQ